MQILTGYDRQYGMLLSENRNSVITTTFMLFVNIILAFQLDQEQVLFIDTFSAFSSMRNVPRLLN